MNFHPFRIRVRHKFEEGDCNRRINFSRWLIQQFENADFVNKIVIGDEAAFTLNGLVNTHNTVKYAPRGQPPEFNFDRSNTREKVTVWAALCGNGRVLVMLTV